MNKAFLKWYAFLGGMFLLPGIFVLADFAFTVSWAYTAVVVVIILQFILGCGILFLDLPVIRRMIGG